MDRCTRFWISFFSFLVLVTGAQADLPPYELRLIENHLFRDHDRSSTMESLRLTKADLMPFICDGRREFNFLSDLLNPNTTGDSLRIKFSKSDGVVVYRDGEIYREDGSKVIESERSDPFVSQVLESLVKLETLPSGKTLIDRLRHTPYPLTITLGAPHFWPSDDAGQPHQGFMMAQAIQHLVRLRWPDSNQQFNHVGAGGPISFNPAMKILLIESDGVKRVVPSYVTLAHEMGHALDGIRGILDRRMMLGEGYEFIEVTEYRASYFENLVRAESGLKFRKYYGDTSSGSLLDKEGYPMLIPAPCLTAEEAELKLSVF